MHNRDGPAATKEIASPRRSLTRYRGETRRTSVETALRNVTRDGQNISTKREEENEFRTRERSRNRGCVDTSFAPPLIKPR